LNRIIFDKIYKICSKAKKNQKIWSDELAHELGFKSGQAMRSAYRRARNEFLIEETANDAPSVFNATTEMHGDGSFTSERIIAIEEENLKNPELLLQLHGFDNRVFELTFAKSNYWQMQSKNGVDGKITLYQSKITCRPRKQPIIDSELIDRLFEKLKLKDFSSISIKPKFYSQNNKALLVPIADLHLGLFATQASTGNDYNIEVAEKSFQSAIAQTKERVANQKFEEIIFVVGNDFLNSDNLTGTTTAGTIQDNDSFWFEMFDKAIELIISGTLSLLEISKVKIVNVVSNHDHQSMYGVMKAVQYYFKDNENVTVDVSQLPRKYYRLGKVLFGFSHDIVIKTALSLMTTESKENWSMCNKYYWFLAHLHQAMQYDRQGSVEIIRIPTISGFSRWSASKGYIQNDKRTQCFVVDKDLGILDILNIYV